MIIAYCRLCILYWQHIALCSNILSLSSFHHFQDVTVDDAHIKTINTLAARLERQNSDELVTVRKRRQQLNERYRLLYFNWDHVPLIKYTCLLLYLAYCCLFWLSCHLPNRWSNFHGNLSSYKRKLEAALEVHALIRELEEVRDRAGEKVRERERLYSYQIICIWIWTQLWLGTQYNTQFIISARL